MCYITRNPKSFAIKKSSEIFLCDRRHSVYRNNFSSFYAKVRQMYYKALFIEKYILVKHASLNTDNRVLINMFIKSHN